MTRQFKLPDLGEGIHEGEILSILVSQGDQVEEDQNVLEVETDKAAVEVPSPYAGTITKIHIKEGDMVKVGEVLFTYDGEGESVGKPQEKPEKKSQEKQPAPREKAEPTVKRKRFQPVMRGCRFQPRLPHAAWRVSCKLTYARFPLPGPPVG